MVLVFCMLSNGGKHFCKVNISNCFPLQVGHNFMTKIISYNIQRAITPKVGKSQLWFLCFVRRLMVVNIRENISNGFQVMKGTQFYDRQIDQRLWQ